MNLNKAKRLLPDYELDMCEGHYRARGAIGLVAVPANSKRHRDPLSFLVGIVLRLESYKVFDAANWRCQMCGALISLQAHHIVYRSRGGTHSRDNLMAICFACHDAVHTKGVEATMSETGFSPKVQEMMDRNRSIAEDQPAGAEALVATGQAEAAPEVQQADSGEMITGQAETIEDDGETATASSETAEPETEPAQD